MKIILVVPNECNPDYRVVKQAETLSRAGFNVTVYCACLALSTAKDEVINGVQYKRRLWSIKNVGDNLLNFSRKNNSSSNSNYPAKDVGIKKNVGRKIAKSHKFLPQWIKDILPQWIKDILPQWIKDILPQWIKDILRKLNLTKKYLLLAKNIKVRTKNIIVRNKYIIVRKLFHYLKAHAISVLLYQEICDEAPDIIYCHDGATLLLGAKVAKTCNAHFLYDSHELETHRSPPLSLLRKKFVQLEEARLLPKAYQVFTVGEKIADYLSNAYGIKQPIVLYNSPPVRKSIWPVKWSAHDRTNLRDEIGVSSQDTVCVYTGNIAFGRGCEDVIMAISKMRECKVLKEESLPYFAMVGRVADAVKDDLIKLASSLRVEDRVHFLAPVSAQSVSEFVSTADIAIIPVQPKALSYEYAMPNKLFEAMLAGITILGTNLSEMGPFIKKYNLGTTYVPGDTDDLAKQLSLLIKGKEMCICADRKEIISQFCWEAQEEKLLQVVEKIRVERSMVQK